MLGRKIHTGCGKRTTTTDCSKAAYLLVNLVLVATASRGISMTSERIRRYGLSHLPMRY